MSDKTSRFHLEPNLQFGFLQVRPTPSPEEITRFYASEFYSSQYPGFNNSMLETQRRDAEFHEAHWNDLRKTIEAVSGRPLAGQKLLDVGCGWAQALLFFKKHGADCSGFDPAPEAVEHACRQGLRVKRAGMETIEAFPGERFDVVTLLNVLEHLADPVAVMREIHLRVLKPGGVLVVEVPNEFNAFQVCGQKLHGLREWWVAPPGHLNYFNGASLRRLMEGTGYRVASTEASFPMEMFLLFGDNYVGDKTLGRASHEKRMAFELNLRRGGFEDALRGFYRALAESNLGRQVTTYAIAEPR